MRIDLHVASLRIAAHALDRFPTKLISSHRLYEYLQMSQVIITTADINMDRVNDYVPDMGGGDV